jgi:folylpolyglutamate synthase/dihydropteroate synthase
VGGQDDSADATRPAVSICRLDPDPVISASDAVTRYLDDDPSSRAEVRPRKLRRVRKLPRSLGDPQEALRAVHVAGHGGKGISHRFSSLRF